VDPETSRAGNETSTTAKVANANTARVFIATPDASPFLIGKDITNGVKRTVQDLINIVSEIARFVNKTRKKLS
jgi:hypothetical protein